VSRTHRILALVAHPGDEALGLGAVLARYADEGADVHLVSATRGEAAPFAGSSRGAFPDAVLGRMRERELEEASGVLGLADVRVLGYPDGGLHAVEPFRAQMTLAAEIRRIRPQVVLLVGPHAFWGHPDHVALGQTAFGAVLAAARHSSPVPGRQAPHAVRKLYELGWSGPTRAAFEEATLAPGIRRPPSPATLPDWMIHASIDTGRYAERALDAVECYRSQPAFRGRPMGSRREEVLRLWARTEFSRSLCTVAGAQGVEADLLAGVRVPVHQGSRAA
jgi:LmbE family N-acetylglucosaminyl deacetylase